VKGKHGAAATVRRDWEALAARAEQAEQSVERLSAQLDTLRETFRQRSERFTAELHQLVAERDAAEGPRAAQLNTDNERLRSRVADLEIDVKRLRLRDKKWEDLARLLYDRLGVPRHDGFEEAMEAVGAIDPDQIVSDKRLDREADIRIGMARGLRGSASIERLTRDRGHDHGANGHGAPGGEECPADLNKAGSRP
jgi:hypothetical protein